MSVLLKLNNISSRLYQRKNRLIFKRCQIQFITLIKNVKKTCYVKSTTYEQFYVDVFQD